MINCRTSLCVFSWNQIYCPVHNLSLGVDSFHRNQCITVKQEFARELYTRLLSFIRKRTTTFLCIKLIELRPFCYRNLFYETSPNVKQAKVDSIVCLDTTGPNAENGVAATIANDHKWTAVPDDDEAETAMIICEKRGASVFRLVPYKHVTSN